MTIATALQTSSEVLFGHSRLIAERNWFAKLVRHFVKAWQADHPADAGALAAESPDVRARRAIARASWISAASGAASGAVSTGAELTANSSLAWLGIPSALAAVGGEALFRIKLHVELTCTLAQMFSIRFDVDDPSDLWRLYALTLHTHAQPQDAEPGRRLIGELTDVGEAQMAREIGTKLVSETLLRNVMPGLAVASSAYMNYRLTKRLGDNVRRYMRYQRALQDAFAMDEAALEGERELLIEGVWFVFTADGAVNPEEAVLLAKLLHTLAADARQAVLARFTVDESDWLVRIAASVAEPARRSFLSALEVAAAVDKEVSLPEQKILGRAARALGCAFDLQRVQEMIRAFEADSLLPQSPVASSADAGVGTRM
jgi:hypothetical protein